MKDAQKPDHVGLNSLIGWLREGRFVIPDFQREFEWKPWDIRDLMRSIFLDYFIGSLLLWKGKKENFDALSCEPVYGFEGTNRREYIVLDGQQRLTALFYAFLGPDVPLPNRSNRAIYYLQADRFMAEEYDKAFNYDWNSKWMRNLLADEEAQFEEHIFPLFIIGEGGRKLYRWFEGYENYWNSKTTALRDNVDETFADNEEYEKTLAATSKHALNAEQFSEYVAELVEQYQISYIELDKDLAVDKVCDIFTQINSKGIPLDAFDLINALLKPKGLQLKKMWREAAPRLEFVDTDKMNVYVLQVMSILRQNYCSPKYLYYLMPGQIKQVRDSDGTRREEILVVDKDDFKARWEDAVDALEVAIKLLSHPQEFGAISTRFLPYYSIIPVFAALQLHLKTLPPERQLDAQRKIRHWYWAAVFNNRYSGSVESTSARDFLDVKAWLADNTAEPAMIEDFKSRFRGLELRKEVKPSSSIYNGIFNLLVLAGARDWVTGNVPQHDDLDDHHIVPASWGKKHLEGNIIHTILNRTPLTSETNRYVIGDKLPNEYLPEWIERSEENTVRGILETHFISPAALDILLRDPFTPNDFEEFISERQRTFKNAIEDLLVKERLDLPINLRQLDAEIETVELKLRNAVLANLNGDIALVPQHVLVKVDERVGRAVKKNSALDADRYQVLEGKLEFFDLREIQETITGKSSWQHFEDQFSSKGTLAGKFDQLSELRNGIRHSRTVDEVTKKEGEAAIIWFQQLLNN
jgi:hypothetical protein